MPSINTPRFRQMMEEVKFGATSVDDAAARIDEFLEAEIRRHAGADAARLDLLERLSNEPQGLLLHDGEPGKSTGRRGLGLHKIGRTLRQAIDALRRDDANDLSKMVAHAGYCVDGDRCVCGGDLPRIRAGCSNWKQL